MSNVNFSVSKINMFAAEHIAGLDLLVTSSTFLYAEIIEAIDNERLSAPEVIYTSDAFEVCTDHELNKLVSAGDVQELTNWFSDCDNALQCLESEANAIVELVYKAQRQGIIDDVEEVVEVLRDATYTSGDGTKLDAIDGDLRIGVDNEIHADALETGETGNLTDYSIHCDGKHFFAVLTYGDIDDSEQKVIISIEATESADYE